MNNTKWVLLISCIVSAVFRAAMGIAALVISAKDGHNACIRSDYNGIQFGYNTYLIVYGCTSIAVIAVGLLYDGLRVLLGESNDVLQGMNQLAIKWRYVPL